MCPKLVRNDKSHVVIRQLMKKSCFFTVTTSLFVIFYLDRVAEDHIIIIVKSPMLRMTLLMPEIDSAAHMS